MPGCIGNLSAVPTAGSDSCWWGEATVEPPPLRFDAPSPAREDARPTSMGRRFRADDVGAKLYSTSLLSGLETE